MDVVAELAGLPPGSPVHALRARREQARAQSQAAYDALFRPGDAGTFPVLDRLAVAMFVAGVHGQAAIATFYSDAYTAAHGRSAIPAATDIAIVEAEARGPYGRYPAGPLSAEDADGLEYRVGAALRQTLGVRLVAAYEHAHMLVFHPRDATPAHLQALLDAGWSTTDIVTLSQLVSFLSYQVRVLAGLRAMTEAGG